MQEPLSALRSYRLRSAVRRPEGSGAPRSALFVICSEHVAATAFAAAVDPALVLQNFGGTVPPPGAVSGGDVSTLAYALQQERVRHVVLCGHAACRAPGFAPAAATPERLSDRLFTPQQRASQVGLLLQMDRVQAHARAWDRHVELHTLWFDEDEGDVYAYRPAERRFTLFGDLDAERLVEELGAAPAGAAS